MCVNLLHLVSGSCSLAAGDDVRGEGEFFAAFGRSGVLCLLRRGRKRKHTAGVELGDGTSSTGCRVRDFTADRLYRGPSELLLTA